MTTFDINLLLCGILLMVMGFNIGTTMCRLSAGQRLRWWEFPLMALSFLLTGMTVWSVVTAILRAHVGL